MEYKSMGQLIQSLRKEKGLTQKQLADLLNITDKAVSKWERDIACPDTATLPKLADILEIPIESLLNAKIKATPEDSVLGNINDTNPHAEMYKERTKQHLLKGLPGFIIAFVLFLVALFVFVLPSSETGITIPSSLLSIICSVFVGLIFAGFPYGWSLINRFLGQWSIFGSIPVLIFLFGLKFALSFWIGMVTYPIVLIYTFIRSQKTKRRVRNWTIVVISTVVLWHALIGGYAIIDARLISGENRNIDNAETTAIQVVDAETFREQHTIVDVACKNALDATKGQEKEIINAYGWTVTEPSQLHGVFFLAAKNPENPHYNILEKLNLSNAVVVVTGYFLQDADITINQWEMDVTVYPNFVFDKNDNLTYDNEKVYSHSCRADDVEDLKEWLSSEYSDMSITEVDIP